MVASKIQQEADLKNPKEIEAGRKNIERKISEAVSALFEEFHDEFGIYPLSAEVNRCQPLKMNEDGLLLGGCAVRLFVDEQCVFNRQGVITISAKSKFKTGMNGKENYSKW